MKSSKLAIAKSSKIANLPRGGLLEVLAPTEFAATPEESCCCMKRTKGAPEIVFYTKERQIGILRSLVRKEKAEQSVSGRTVEIGSQF